MTSTQTAMAMAKRGSGKTARVPRRSPRVADPRLAGGSPGRSASGRQSTDVLLTFWICCSSARGRAWSGVRCASGAARRGRQRAGDGSDLRASPSGAASLLPFDPGQQPRCRLGAKAVAVVAVSATLAAGAVYGVPELKGASPDRSTPSSGKLVEGDPARALPGAANAAAQRVDAGAASRTPSAGAGATDGTRPGSGRPAAAGKPAGTPMAGSSGAGRPGANPGASSTGAGKPAKPSKPSKPSKPTDIGKPASTPGGRPANPGRPADSPVARPPSPGGQAQTPGGKSPKAPAASDAP